MDRRNVLLTTAGAICLAVLIDKVLYRIPAAIPLYTSDPVLPETAQPTLWIWVRYGWWIAASTLALALVVVADNGVKKGAGYELAGLGQSLRTNTRTLGAWWAWLIPVLGAPGLLISLLVTAAPGLQHWVGSDGLSESNLWFMLYQALMAGVVEEIVVIAVAFRLLQELPRNKHGIPFEATGWATLILVALRLSYHHYYGLAMVALIPWAWLVVRLYRNTRSLPALIVAHVGFNVTLSLLSHPIALVIVGLIILRATGRIEVITFFRGTAQRQSVPVRSTGLPTG